VDAAFIVVAARQTQLVKEKSIRRKRLVWKEKKKRDQPDMLKDELKDKLEWMKSARNMG